MYFPEALENTPFIGKVPVYEKCKVFTCNYTCNLHVIIDSVSKDEWNPVTIRYQLRVPIAYRSRE